MSVTTIDPPGRATAGIDWAIDGHVISIVDPSGTETRRASVPHTIAGLRRLVRLLHEAEVTEVGIERPTARSSTPCSPPGSWCWSSPPTRSRTCARATARPVTRTTGSTPTCWRTPSAPTATAWSH